MDKVYVYVAGPYTSDPEGGVRAAIEAAEDLRDLGYVPFVPHLSHLWDQVSPHPYRYWMELDLDWLRQCDALLRLPGESKGADEEVTEAMLQGIPVFYSVADLHDYYFARLPYMYMPSPVLDAARPW